MSEKVTSQDGTVIAVERTGNGPPLAMIDPAGAFHGMRPMAELAAKLADHFTVYTYDRRGRGASGDQSPYHVEREVDDLSAVIAHAGDHAYVFGFSSGAALAAHAAAGGLPVTGLMLLEPAIDLREPASAESELGSEVAELVAADKRGEAYLHFNRSIGVPEEMIAGLTEMPVWPELESLAHTLVYDTHITGSMSAEILSRVRVPTLVVSSEASDHQLQAMSDDVAAAIPGAIQHQLPGGWHGPDQDLLAAEIVAHWERTVNI